MKITIIDQHSGSIHEVAPNASETPESHDFGWFDPDHFLDETNQLILTEDDDIAAAKRIRFADGREVDINPHTGDVLAV